MNDSIVGTPLDYGLIIGYFVVVLGFGALFARFTKSTKDFFFGGQRFSWWLIAFSCVATTVGSYSFYKYSSKAFSYGLSSSMTYLNDWFWMPLWAFGWLPIIYFMRITSIPEYFEKRFDRPSRTMATVILLIYMVGYIGINLLTLGKCLNVLLGWPVFGAAALVAAVTGVYVMAGGQTSVIMTDLLQGMLLLVAGFVLLFLGFSALGDGKGLLAGASNFWHLLPPGHRLPFAGFNRPADFNSVGIFWQDAFGNGVAFYFLNQGLIMRFLSARSVREGRKAMFFILLVLMPLAAVAVSNAGWIGKALAVTGLIHTPADLDDVFVVVADALCRPGVFGLVLAALTAALMSTADTLINAVSAVAVNDIYRPYIKPGRSDKHYLSVSRWVSIGTAALGLSLVPVFGQFGSIYVAHGTFTAAVTPPMAIALLFGVFWNRFTPRAALWTMLGGSLAVGLSFIWPQLITPFAHGTPMFAHGDFSQPSYKAYTYIRALYALVVSAAIGIVVTFFTRPKERDEIKGLTWNTVKDAMRIFKGSEPNLDEGREVRARPVFFEQTEPGQADLVQVDPIAMKSMSARSGDLVHVRDSRRWLGGLRSVHARLGEPAAEPGTCRIPLELAVSGSLQKSRRLLIEKMI
jgi:solute:Na+ symporter, SSS family